MRSSIVALFICSSFVLNARLPDFIPFRKGNLWGYCDSAKKILIAPQWEEAGFFSGNCARVSRDSKYGLIDKSGNYVQQPIYDNIDEEVVHGLRAISIGEEGKIGMVDGEGKIVLPLIHEWFHWEGVLLQALRPGCKAGVYDSTGRVVIPFDYKSCGDFPVSMGDSALFALCKKGKWGVIDTLGNVIIPFKFYWITAEGSYWHAYTSWGEGKYYTSRGVLIGDSVSIVYAPWPERQTAVNGCRVIQGTNGLYGFADDQWREIISPKYLAVQDFNQYGLADVYIRKGLCEFCFIRGYVSKDGTEYWED